VGEKEKKEKWTIFTLTEGGGKGRDPNSITHHHQKLKEKRGGSCEEQGGREEEGPSGLLYSFFLTEKRKIRISNMTSGPTLRKGEKFKSWEEKRGEKEQGQSYGPQAFTTRKGEKKRTLSL